jgi:hypothetical protein
MKSYIKYIVYGVLAVFILLVTVATYIGLFYAVDNYIDGKIDQAISKQELVQDSIEESNVHDVIIVKDILTKNLEPYTVIVRSQQHYDECRLSVSESTQIAHDIRDYMANVTFDNKDASDFKKITDHIKGIANKYSIKVYDVRFTQPNKRDLWYKYEE